MKKDKSNFTTELLPHNYYHANFLITFEEKLFKL